MSQRRAFKLFAKSVLVPGPLLTSLFIVGSAALSGAATAAPPAQPPQKHQPAEPDVALRVDGDLLQYTYDLSSLFDEALWQVLEDNGFSEITVEVRLRDAKSKVRVSQYHSLQIQLLTSGKVRVMTSQRRGRIYASRAAMLEALARVRGQPIRATEFSGEAGHIEIVALVNPVQVYSFPEKDVPIAAQKLEQKTHYDRKLELRSPTVRP